MERRYGTAINMSTWLPIAVAGGGEVVNRREVGISKETGEDEGAAEQFRIQPSSRGASVGRIGGGWGAVELGSQKGELTFRGRTVGQNFWAGNKTCCITAAMVWGGK